MRFNDIEIIEGFYHKKIEFSENGNLIYSKNNSKGKTTLLRFLLYGLGYKIPSTKKINFDKCKVIIKLTNNNVIYNIIREYDYLEVDANGIKHTYILPDEAEIFHAQLYGTDNHDILKNILGVFYVDQEKGWTFLNRGTVIGSIKFNIEEYIRGLCDIDCIEEENELKLIKNDLLKYKKLLNIAEYQEKIIEVTGSLVDDSSDEDEITLIKLELEEQSLSLELKRLNKVINDNRNFINFIENMKLSIFDSNGELITITKNNLVGYNDNISVLKTKQSILAHNLSKVKKEIRAVKTKQEDDQLSFDSTEELLKSFDAKLSSVNVDARLVKNIIGVLEKRQKELDSIIDFKTKHDNVLIANMYKNILKYANELGLQDTINDQNSYLFTKNLKELSGAVLHKMVFAFKLAYIIELEKKLDIKVPIILDSPSGKEVDKENTSKMMEILNRDFQDNQIIIASINKYNEFNEINIIELGEFLIDEKITIDE